jgi:hypothetical protein
LKDPIVSGNVLILFPDRSRFLRFPTTFGIQTLDHICRHL